jgi:trehalose 6-phosphate synthase
MIDEAPESRASISQPEVARSGQGGLSGVARRLILVSNRGPIEHVGAPGGRLRARKGSGGVISALSALGREVEVTWIAAAMTARDR